MYGLEYEARTYSLLLAEYLPRAAHTVLRSNVECGTRGQKCRRVHKEHLHEPGIIR